MKKIFSRHAVLAVAATAVLALPATAQAGGHDRLHKVFRDLDRGVTRVVHHTDRTMTRLFRWCDRR